uniref:C-type LECtin n=1 Tax=Caenorhabditis tropicalis TaxID=1561998 RepID=A0A1I7T3T5_9PELO
MFKLVTLALAALALASAQSSDGPFDPTDWPVFVSTPLPTPGGSNVDRECGGDLANLWLDVVVVVDNSKGMTDEGITQVAANIATVFGNGTKIGNQYSDPRSTRIGLVTYNGVATVVADLNLLQSIDDLYSKVFSTLTGVSNSDDSFLVKGIGAAESVLQNGRAQGVRSNYKRLVVVYASAYKGEGELDPIPAAERLKSSGVIISTVAFDQDGDEALLAGLANIASPNYAYTSKDLNLVGEIQGAALQTNCFCPNLWTQYKANFDDENSYKYGVCIRAATISSSWTAAKFACQNLAKNGFLATEFDGQKHNFLFRVAQNNTAFAAPYIYHIGLSWVNGAWNWQQPAGLPLRPNSNYAPWNPSYPKSSSSNIGVLEQQFSSDLTVGWQNINAYSVAEYYMCEVASCDTEKYCP